ncbi:MAG: MFS transporter, partial [Bauldia sp.]
AIPVFLLLRPLAQRTVSLGEAAIPAAPVLAPLFLKLAVSFFAICAVGLMVVSHSTGILSALGAADGAWLGPILYNLGYIGGSLTGGRLEQAVGGRVALTIINAAMIVALLPLAFTAPLPLALAALALIGATLGGVASVMPMVVSDRYGHGALGAVYGKLNVAYGLGGLIAPWLAGVLYVATGSYALAMWFGIALAAIGVAASLAVGRKPASPMAR